ncbi:hypothetical protein MY4038_008445 [Beauveria bassiana]
MGAYVVPHSDIVYRVVGKAQLPFGDGLLPDMLRKTSVRPFKSIIQPGPRARHSTTPQTPRQLSSIALDNGDNSTFYETFETHVTSSLQLPTVLDTYKRHADKMYQMYLHRYLLEFPRINGTTSGSKPGAMGDGGDAEPAAKNVQMALDSVCAWVIDRKLLCLPSPPQIAGGGGGMSGNVSHMPKSLTRTSNVLENGQTNLNGKSF